MENNSGSFIHSVGNSVPIESFEWISTGTALFQMTFALFMGMVLATLMIQTNRIWPLIMYQILNNTISSITNSDTDPTVSLYVSVAVFTIGVTYLIVLSVSKRRISSEQERQLIDSRGRIIKKLRPEYGKTPIFRFFNGYPPRFILFKPD